MTSPKSDPHREYRVTTRMLQVLDATDGAPRTPPFDAARAAFRAEVYAIADDTTPEERLELREQALARFDSAVAVAQAMGAHT